MSGELADSQDRLERIRLELDRISRTLRGAADEYGRMKRTANQRAEKERRQRRAG